MINLKLPELALSLLSGTKRKYIFLTLILTLLIFSASSVFFITGAIRQEAEYTAEALPDMIITQYRAGFRQFIDISYADRILEIPGVSYAEARIWGLYPYEYLNSNLTIIGVDVFSDHNAPFISQALDRLKPENLTDPEMMITGAGLADTIKQIYNTESFNFQCADGEYLTLKPAGIFKPDSQMISADTVMVHPDTAAKILGIPEGRATDIAVYIPNPEETETIASKITSVFPDVKIITKDSAKASFQNIFDYKSGIFLLFFSTCLLTFFIIVFDRFSGIGNDEKKQTSVLKALGFNVSDILKIKFYEAAAVGITAFLSGTSAAMLYVFYFQAPLLKKVFTGYSYLAPELILPFHVSVYDFAVIFFSTVPVYAASVIVPAWKSAVTDAGESLR